MRRFFLTIAALLISSFIFGQEIKSVKVTELEKIFAESKTPLIVNMWATWCGPCIQEIPYFIKEVDKNNSLLSLPGDHIRLLLVSLDFKEAFPKEITKFINKRKIAASVAWLDETNADYFCPKIDSNWSGAIPATLFLNNKTGYRNFVEGQISPEDLKKEIRELLLNR